MRAFVLLVKVSLVYAVVLQTARGVAASLPGAGCTSTSEYTPALSQLPPAPGGYRVKTVHWDPVLQRRWAVVNLCEHPEWPSFTLLLQDRGPSSREKHQLIMHAGDVVRLRSQEEFLRIEMAAIAEESGAVGDTIRVRLQRPALADYGAETSSTSATVRAVVRGSHDVEMAP